MRTSSNTLWLLVVVAMLAVLTARLSRSLGAFGLILTVFLVIVLVRLLRDLLQSRFRQGGDDRERAATKNVTPQEGWLPPGVKPTGGSAAAPAFWLPSSFRSLSSTSSTLTTSWWTVG